MKSYTSCFKNHEWLFVCLVFLAMSLFYFSHLTTSGLWYDEAIEFFYSKYMTGTLPVGRPLTENMYERICATYQPPLYNVLMYFWLLLFDSEVAFRLAGVLTTFIGALGFYCALKKIANSKWGLVGVCVYLSAYSIRYYALECAEYNLLLCMECWMLYFFICCLSDDLPHARKRVLIGFYLFAVLSVYSQYGSAFLIVALFLTLCYTYVKRKDYVSLRWLLGLGFVTILVAIVPLWIWFIQIQIQKQGSAMANHHPIFVRNVLYSLVKSFCNSVSWIFSMSVITKGKLSFVMNSIVAFMGICSICSFFRGKRDVLAVCVMACIFCFMAFFIASACSFYAYNSWDGRYGCMNIIDGGRYILFFAPMLILTLMTGMYMFYQNIAFKMRNLMMCVAIGISMFFYVQLWVSHSEVKNDVREATKAWMEAGGYRSHTLVQEWAAGTFHFYFQHSPVYNQETLAKIITTDSRMRAKDKEAMMTYLMQIDVFKYSELYYVGNKWSPASPGNLEMVKDIFIQKGFDVETLKEEQQSVVLRMKEKL